MLKFIILLLALIASVWSLSAQDMREIIAQNPERSGSNWCSYRYQPSPETPAPKGYKPFYISYYGRHGSRWHTTSKYYTNALKFFEDAAKQDALTELGKDAYRRMQLIAEHAAGREGMLTSKGVQEHRGIAERMVSNYPEIFLPKGGAECRIECLSTLYPRCILSMAANNERIKELNPKVQFSRATGERYKTFLATTKSISPLALFETREIMPMAIRQFCNPERFIKSLFKPEYATTVDGYNVILRIFYIASIMQNFDDTTLSLYDLFTADELYGLWRVRNLHFYVATGNSEEFGDCVAADAVLLMRHIIEDVDDVLANGGRSGFLRFGHDMSVVPLMQLLQMEGRSPRMSIYDFDKIHEKWKDIFITSMAANVQLVFYRNKQGDVLVKALHNEAEVRLPLKSDCAPYYRWEEFRSYYLARMEQLSKVEQPDCLKKYIKGQNVL